MKLSIATALAFIASVSAGSVVNLTSDNYESLTSGKIVFIKFFAPWCGHCKAMAADWEQLAGDFAGDANKMIAEVDCTEEENQDLCQENEVQGFPTIKFGEPFALEDYQGGRDYESLSAFAKDNLKPACSPFNISLCEGDAKAAIEKVMAMSEEDLNNQIDAVDEELDALEKHMETEIEKLQATYEKLMEENEAKTKAAKDKSNYKLLKSVAAFRAKEAGNDEL
jgi:protein disulfide-isomerase-like protein